MTSLPDFKSSFPKWSRSYSGPLVAGLEDHGLNLLDDLLRYDPANRLSAKQACRHPYFENGASSWSGRGVKNGAHSLHSSPKY